MTDTRHDTRRYPVGAEILHGGTSVRVWAPVHDRVSVVVDPDAGRREVALTREDGGYFSAVVAGAPAGTRYLFRLGDAPQMFPDPASRFQPDGPHGPSVVVDDTRFGWTDAEWAGVPRERHVLYEMHVGTFTPGGTWQSAADRLPDLVDLGITTIEVMPVAEFAGRVGWGYDGVAFFAPHHHYGTPDDLRTFVDRAHGVGLAVVLDVVYNHFGPDGCYMSTFSPHYESDRYRTDWGTPPNYDGEQAGPVREFVIANARYWIETFHFDGLRLDATQDVKDASPRHILAEITEAVREAGRGRHTLVVAENEPQQARLVRPVAVGGYGIDALWNDDFHHSAVVAATGRAEAYYSDHRGTAMEFVAAARHGFLFQGQRYAWQGAGRGTPSLDLAPERFVHFVENHDQVANSARGLRLHQQTSPARFRALTALLLLGPQLPMLFQGQEFNSSAPFLYFADHNAELSLRIREGRCAFLAQFPSIASPEAQALVAAPDDPSTYTRSVLDWSERDSHDAALALHRDLLALRRTDPVMNGTARAHVEAAVLTDRVFLIRLFGSANTVASSPAPVSDLGDRMLLVNLGPQWSAPCIAEPLLAPPTGCDWVPVWSSEATAYGGTSAPPAVVEGRWFLAADSAVLVAARPHHEEGAP